jgi:hypothetical protein
MNAPTVLASCGSCAFASVTAVGQVPTEASPDIETIDGNDFGDSSAIPTVRRERRHAFVEWCPP